MDIHVDVHVWILRTKSTRAKEDFFLFQKNLFFLLRNGKQIDTY